MFSKSRLIVNVWGFLLIPCVGLPLNGVSCLNSVIFEPNIQGSCSLSYIALWALPAAYLVDCIHGLAGILLVFQSEHMLADGGGMFKGTGDARFLSIRFSI